MAKITKKPVSIVKRVIAGLAIAYGIHFIGILGIGAYHEHELKHSPAWEEYREDVAEIRLEKLDNLRELCRLNKTKESLESASNYLSNHSLENTIVFIEPRGFNLHYDQEKQRLETEIEEYKHKRKEARAKLLTNPDAQKHLKHLDTCLTRAFIPFSKPRGDYFPVLAFEDP